MTDRDEGDPKEFSEEAESLWLISLAPVTWAGHFVLCYASVAIACEKFGRIGWLWIGLAVATLVALALIAWLGWRAFRQWDVFETGDFSNPEGEAEDRHQFLGHAAFLLAIISFIGVVYTALPILLVEGCI